VSLCGDHDDEAGTDGQVGRHCGLGRGGERTWERCPQLKRRALARGCGRRTAAAAADPHGDAGGEPQTGPQSAEIDASVPVQHAGERAPGDRDQPRFPQGRRPVDCGTLHADEPRDAMEYEMTQLFMHGASDAACSRTGASMQFQRNVGCHPGAARHRRRASRAVISLRHDSDCTAEVRLDAVARRPNDKGGTRF
jgi:hypothetical protein